MKTKIFLIITVLLLCSACTFNNTEKKNKLITITNETGAEIHTDIKDGSINITVKDGSIENIKSTTHSAALDTCRITKEWVFPDLAVCEAHRVSNTQCESECSDKCEPVLGFNGDNIYIYKECILR